MMNLLAALGAWLLFSFLLACGAGLVMHRAGRNVPTPLDDQRDQAKRDQAERDRALAAWAEHELGQLRAEMGRALERVS